MEILIIGCGLGLVVGIISSFLGLGGGIIIVPLLPVFVPGLSAREVIATSLCSVFLVVSINTLRFSRKKSVMFSHSLLLGISSGITAYIAARATAYFSEDVLYGALVLVLLLASVRTLLGGYSRYTGRYKVPEQTGVKKPGKIFSGFVGSLSGAVSGFTGLGGGSVMSPLLLSAGVLEEKNISPTVNGAMILTSLLGVLGYTVGEPVSWPTWGSVHLDAMLGIVCGSYLTGTLGVKYQEKLCPQTRCWILGSLLLGLAVKVSFSIL